MDPPNQQITYIYLPGQPPRYRHGITQPADHLYLPSWSATQVQTWTRPTSGSLTFTFLVSHPGTDMDPPNQQITQSETVVSLGFRNLHLIINNYTILYIQHTLLANPLHVTFILLYDMELFEISYTLPWLPLS